MSKIKMSFSLIIAILLVGIMSTAVFAASAYHMNGAPQYDATGKLTGLKVSFNGYSPSIDPTGTSFTVKITAQDKDGNYTIPVDQGSGTLGTSTFHGNFIGTVTIPPTNLKVSTTYQVELYRTSDLTKIVEKSYSLIPDTSHNTSLLNIADGSKVGAEGETLTIDTKGSGLTNANLTGLNNTRKNRSGQKVHGFYQNNTNSCASCHQTHTAANGEYLLFKDGTYSTCSACHDGTTGAYNSFAPASEETTASIAGTFDVKAAGHNGSLHESDGSLQISAAPGGNHDVDGNSTSKVTWGQEFNCASCHAAHGSGTGNNLNLDPMGWAQVAYSTTNKDTQNGKLFKGLTINTTVPTDFSTPYILVKKTLTASDISTSKTSYGYMYTRNGLNLAEGTKVIQTYRWDGKKYVADFSLWLRDKGHVSAPFTNADTVFYGVPGTDGKPIDVTKSLSIVWRDGFAYGPAVDNVASANIAIGVDVETTDDPASLFDSANTNYIVDSGLQMSKYCASCHTDYLSTTRTNDTGTYTTAHRHATAQDRLSCVRCHYAHGSEATIMKDSNDQTYFEGPHAGDLSYYVDPNPSSALKRYTGMSVCYACHGQGEAFLGNPNNVERPVTGQPGAARGSNY